MPYSYGLKVRAENKIDGWNDVYIINGNPDKKIKIRWKMA